MINPRTIAQDQEARIAGLELALQLMINVSKTHVATHLVFRSKPAGFEKSPARLRQEDQIATEDALLGAIKTCKELLNGD